MITTRYILLILIIFLWISPGWSAPAEPLLVVQYREDMQSREQERELTRILDLSLRLRLQPTGDPDHWVLSGIEVEEARGRQLFGLTTGSEVYVLGDVVPGKNEGRVSLWRDSTSGQVLAVSLPEIVLGLLWQGPSGPEPPENLVIGPVSNSSGGGGYSADLEYAGSPALPDEIELPQWLKDKGVHPDYAVDSCPEEGSFVGGGAWLMEEPDSISEKTYLWEFVTKK